MIITKKLLIVVFVMFVALSLFAEEYRPSRRNQDFTGFSSYKYAAQAARADSATGFDVQKYEIHLQVNDVTRYINGNVIAHVLAEENLNSIQYELEFLTVSQVLVNNQPVAYTHQNGLINIPLSVTAGQSFTTNVFYSGYPQLSPNLYQIGMIFSANTVFTISDPDAGRYWWPSYDHPWDKAIVDLHIRMRSDWKVAANGLRQGIVQHGDGTSTTTWIGYNPMTTYLVCITAGPYVEINQSLGDLPIQHFVMPNQYNNALIDLAATPQMIDYYSGLFGAYPFEKYGHAVVSMSTYGAMEHQTMTTLGNFVINGTASYEWLIAHDLAHQGFGICVSFLTFADVWLSESFATYSEHLWIDKTAGWNAAVNYIQSSYHNYYINWENSAGAATIYNPSFYNYFSPPSYEKGASVLHMLRLKIGDALFFELLQTWVSTYHNHNAVTAEFQAMAEDISGLDLHQFFQQWIYSPGIPSLEYSIYTKANPPQLKVIGKTTSPTATNFQIDFPIRVQTATATDSLLAFATPAGYVNIFAYPELASISTIDIDPNNWVLLRGKTGRVPQLTECLATNSAVLLSWADFINASGYNIYRSSGSDGPWVLLNPAPLTATSYLDEDVSNGGLYRYAIKAFDSFGFESLLSNIMTATPIEFSFASNILVVDETRDGTGTGISPTDEMVDAFYSQALHPIAFDTWDYNQNPNLNLQTLGQYRLVLWHDDDFTNNFLIDNLSLLGGYILGGGKVIISGWKSASVLNSEWLERFTGSVELVYDNSASLISALSDDYPVLLPDPDKLSPSWNGMLPMIYTFDNVQTSLYTANMLPGSLGNGKSLAFKYDNHGSLVMFGLPLYFLQADGVRTMLQQLIRELLPGVEAADHILPVPNLSLTAYPNPFGSQVSFEVKGISGKAGSLDIYNVKGQRVKRIALSPGNRDYTWNGLDESGNKTAPGIYFIKASDTRAQITRKIIKL